MGGGKLTPPLGGQIGSITISAFEKFTDNDNMDNMQNLLCIIFQSITTETLEDTILSTFEFVN